MPVGLGGALVEGLGGNLNQQIANALAGPSANPNPGAASGGPGAAPGGPGVVSGAPAPSPGANLPPAQAYAPDPANANTIALLLKVHQQDALSNDLNQRIQGISASFGTAQQQHDKMAAVMAGTGDDRLKAISESQGIMQEQQKQTEHSQFIAGADIMGQQLLGLKPGQGAWLAQSGQLPEIVQSHLHAMEPTDAIKNWEQTRKTMLDSGMDPKTVDQLMPPEMIMLGPNADISQRQYTIEQIQARAKGQTDFPDYDTWKAQHATKAKISTEAGEDKLNASQSFDTVDANWKEVQGNIDWLNDPKNQQAGIAAVRHPEWTTTGQMGNVLAGTGLVSQDVLTAKNKIDWLKNQLLSERFTGTKNVRSNTEAKFLGSAASNVFAPTNDAATITTELARLKDRTDTARANAAAAAGRQIPAAAFEKVDPALLDKKNPLYNNATVENDFRGMSDAEVDAAVSKLPSGAVFVGPDGHVHTRK